MIVHLVEIMWLNGHLWQSDIAYEQGYQFWSPNFKCTVLNIYTVLYPYWKPWEIPRKPHFRDAMFELFKDKDDVENYAIFIYWI